MKGASTWRHAQIWCPLKWPEFWRHLCAWESNFRTAGKSQKQKSSISLWVFHFLESANAQIESASAGGIECSRHVISRGRVFRLVHKLSECRKHPPSHTKLEGNSGIERSTETKMVEVSKHTAVRENRQRRKQNSQPLTGKGH